MIESDHVMMSGCQRWISNLVHQDQEVSNDVTSDTGAPGPVSIFQSSDVQNTCLSITLMLFIDLHTSDTLGQWLTVCDTHNLRMTAIGLTEQL